MTPGIDRVICDSRTIAGLLREALFQSRSLQARLGALFLNFAIVDIDEGGTREKSINRDLVVQLQGNEDADPILRTDLQFSCNFLKFIASWRGTIDKKADGSLRIRFPNELRLIDNRSNIRHAIGSESTLSSPVLVVTDSLFAEGHLQLIDFSQPGLGGVLRVIQEMPVRVGTTINGVVRSKAGNVEVNGQIVNAELRHDGNAVSGEVFYQVGVKSSQQIIESKSSADTPALERRKEQRVSVELSFVIISPFKEQHKVSVRLQNASCVGFKAKLNDPADSVLFPIGCMVAIPDSTLLAKVVHLNEDLIHFQIADGSDADRLSWLKLLTPFQNPNTSSGTPTGLDIIDLFCESGAAAAGYLKNQRRFANEFLDGMSSTSANGIWIHRWIERNKTGNIKGHVSAVRMSDNTWYIGDIAGMTSSDLKISQQFLPRFLGYIREYAVNSTPCPAFFLSWQEGHPYWQGWETRLKTTDRHNVVGFARTAYTRLGMSVANVPGKSVKIDFKWISAKSYQDIESYRSQLKVVGLQFLADGFDFSIYNFGSPSLKRQLNASQQQFNRAYARILIEDSAFLVMFQKFPAGTSPLRTGDVPWVLPLDNVAVSKDSHEIILDTIRAEGLKAGFNFPGVMTAQIGQHGEERGTSKTMLWTLTHPDGLAYIYENRRVE
jgi:hypothetical protein